MRSSGSGLALFRAVCVAMFGALAATGTFTQSPQLPPPARPPKTASEPPSTATAALPSARSLIERHVKAIGGREAILSHTSAHATGTVSMPAAGMTGTLEIFAAKPNRAVVRMTIGGVGDVVEAFDGTNGWSISPMSGPMVLQGKELDQKRFDSDFYADLHDASRYESMRTIEKTEFDGRPCYKVSLVRKGGGEDFEFYDAQTGLKAGTILTRETPMGSITATAIETDYRTFGNMLYATTVKQTSMGVQQVIVLSSVEHDKVDPSVFEPPAQIKALLK